MELVKDETNKEKLERENVEAIKAYRATGDEYIREEFFIRNEGLAHHVVRKFENTKLEYSERLSLVNYGFVKAFNTYAVDKDIKFATYAVRCMENEVLMYLRRIKKHSVVTSYDQVVYKNKNNEDRDIDLLDMLEDKSAEYEVQAFIEREHLTQLVEDIRKSLKSERELFIFNNMIKDGDSRLKQTELEEVLGVSQSYISRLVSGIKKTVAYVAKKKELEKGERQITIEPLKKEKGLEKLSKKGLAGLSSMEIVSHLMEEQPMMTPKEISDEYGINIRTVRTYMNTIRRKKEEQKTVEPSKEIVKEVAKPTEAVREPVLEKHSPKKSDLNLISVRGSLAKKLAVSILDSLDEDADYHVYINIEKKEDPK